MKIFTGIVALLLASNLWCRAEDPAVGVLEEKVNKLTALVEDVQFRYQQLQKTIDKIQTDLVELRKAATTGGGVAPAELKALEDRIAAVDAARQKDRQAIIEQLAKELSGTSPGKSPVTSTGKEYVVQKGDTLSSIAKSTGVSIADLKKANNLSGDDIKIGQKLALTK